MSSPIKLEKQAAIAVHVNTTNHDFVKYLFELTWYHNNSMIVPGDDPQLLLSNSNKTLTISNFTSIYGGIYKVQFDQLLIYPFNENCKDEVLSLMRNYPILKPAVFCVNIMDSDCFDTIIKTQVRKISIRSVDFASKGTFDNLTLEADATVLSHKELEHSSIYWYRNGIPITSTLYLSTLQRHYNNLSLSQRFQQFNTTYEHSGRYEVLLKLNINTYISAGNSRLSCQSYYNNFVLPYLSYSSRVTVAKGFVDIDYHKGKFVPL